MNETGIESILVIIKKKIDNKNRTKPKTKKANKQLKNKKMKSIFTAFTLLSLTLGTHATLSPYVTCCNNNNGDYHIVESQHGQSSGICKQDNQYTNAKVFYNNNCKSDNDLTGDEDQCWKCIFQDCYHYGNCEGAHQFGGNGTGDDSQCHKCSYDQCYQYTNCLHDYGHLISDHYGDDNTNDDITD